jgi:flagellar protein FliO/FliZ
MLAAMMRHVLFLTAVPLLPLAARADEAGVPDAGTGILQMSLGLLLVLAMVVASLWLLKRLSAPRGGAAGLLRVVAGTSVGPRERVVVLEIGTTWLVLGVAPGRVSALAEVPRQDTPDVPAPVAQEFSGWLKQIIERRNDPR